MTGRRSASGAGVLGGLQVVELASFVAAPSAGMTMAQLGASVIRIDPPGGAPDRDRWPLAPSGASLYWANLNRGKRSVVLDVRRPEGQELVLALSASGGPGGGVLVDNLGGAAWLDHEPVRCARADMIHVRVLGRADGAASVDYTANAATGLPGLTGPEDTTGPVNHVLPAWDLITGLHAVVGVLGALRRRETTGRGADLTVSLDEVALTGVANLGWAADAELTGRDRGRHGNYVYGSFGTDFETADGHRVMVVALTGRQWHSLGTATGTTAVFDALGESLGLDLDRDEDRFAARDVIAAVLRPWFGDHTLAEVTRSLDRERVLWGPYRSMTEAVATYADDRPGQVLRHVDQPGVGPMLCGVFPVRGLPTVEPVPAPMLGEHTEEVLDDVLGLSAAEIGRLADDGVVGIPSHTRRRSDARIA